MTDTTIVGRHVDVVQTSIDTQPAFAWGAAAAGALAAIAISFILIALGAGIGLLKTSPYSAWPSATALTAAGAIWIVLAQTWGYACGGYIAGRVRTRVPEASSDETNFRDGAHGLVSWALGRGAGDRAVRPGYDVCGRHDGSRRRDARRRRRLRRRLGHAGPVNRRFRSNAGTSPICCSARSPMSPRAKPRTSSQLRPGTGPGSGGAPASSPQGETPPSMQTAGGQDSSQRAEVGRVMTYSLGQGRMADADRAYLGRLVAQRTGLSQAEAEQRVAATEQRARETAKEAADKAAKAASAFSFWTFMSLLMGAAAATLGGIFGGNQRDEDCSAAGARRE